MRVLALGVALLLAASACRRLPPPSSSPAAGPSEAPAETEPARRAAPDSASPTVAAIVDSIRRAVRDSIDAAAERDSAARTARRDSLEAARRDSIEAARRDSVEAARRDSLALAAARDSAAAAAARADSIAEAIRADSIAAAARADSIAAARADSIAEATLDSIRAARADSIAGAIADSILAARVARAGEETARDDQPPPEAAGDEAPAGAPLADDVEELRALGPAYIPYDEGPQAIWDTETQATLTKTLLPVLRREGLGARTRTTFWVLISARGEVAELVLQTTSGSDAFDEAAASFARQLGYRPAMRGGRPVAVWVLREFSIVMR